MSRDPLLKFGPYRLDLGNEQLWRDTQLVRLTPKTMQVLRTLVGTPGQLVNKEELFRVVWPGTVVSDAALASCIQELRQALGDNARSPQYIETVHRRGFRFIASLTTTPLRVPSSEFQVPSIDAASAALPLPDKPSIVVLPFTNMSGDPGQDYFSDGITEDLTSDLSKISSLFVIARNSAFTYKGKAVKVQDVSKEMGVRYVLEGSVRKADEQVRISAQLIDATTGGHLWAERYDRPLKDIFALQDEIVQKIVTTLKLQLTLQEQGLHRAKHTDNVEAYDTFLRGIEAIGRVTKEAVTQARQLWEKAIALDPQYAEAYALLGYTYQFEWAIRYSVDPQTLERALALVQQALALDNSLPIAHSILSLVYVGKQQYDPALAEGEWAIALDPNNAESYMGQAHVLIWAGRPEEAIRMMAQAIRLNPRYQPWYAYQLGWAYRLVGRYAEAIAAMKEVLSRSPNNMAAYAQLTVIYVQQ
jgi:adenylate cyclase